MWSPQSKPLFLSEWPGYHITKKWKPEQAFFSPRPAKKKTKKQGTHTKSHHTNTAYIQTPVKVFLSPLSQPLSLTDELDKFPSASTLLLHRGQVPFALSQGSTHFWWNSWLGGNKTAKEKTLVRFSTSPTNHNNDTCTTHLHVHVLRHCEADELCLTHARNSNRHLWIQHHGPN